MMCASTSEAIRLYRRWKWMTVVLMGGWQRTCNSLNEMGTHQSLSVAVGVFFSINFNRIFEEACENIINDDGQLTVALQVTIAVIKFRCKLNVLMLPPVDHNSFINKFQLKLKLKLILILRINVFFCNFIR